MVFNNKSQILTFTSNLVPLQSNLIVGRSGLQYVDAIVQKDTLSFLIDLGTSYTICNANFLKKSDIEKA